MGRRYKPTDFDPDILAKLQAIWFNGYRRKTGHCYMLDGKTIGQLKTLYRLCDKSLGKVEGVVGRFLLSPSDSHSLGLLLYNLPRYVKAEDTYTNPDTMQRMKVYDGSQGPDTEDERSGPETPAAGGRGPDSTHAMAEDTDTSTEHDGREGHPDPNG